MARKYQGGGGVYQGADTMGASRANKLWDILAGKKRHDKDTQKQLGKRGVFGSISDIIETGVGFIPGWGQIAKPLLDIGSKQLEQQLFKLPEYEEDVGFWGASEVAALKEQDVALREGADETLLEGIIGGAEDYMSSFDFASLFGGGGLPEGTEVPTTFSARKGGRVPKYENGGVTRKTKSRFYEDADPLYIASGIGRGTITEGDGSRGWSMDKDAIDMGFVQDLKAILDKTGGKLIDFQDPDFDPKSEKTQSLQELAEFLSTQVTSKSTSEIEERTEGDKSEIIKDLYKSSTQTQSPYSDLGFFMESSEDRGGFQEAVGQLLQGIPLMEETKVSPKRKGLKGLAQRLLPGGETGYYAGGGMVESSPTIAGYFSQQGKTLGGSDTMPLSKKVGRI